MEKLEHKFKKIKISKGNYSPSQWIKKTLVVMLATGLIASKAVAQNTANTELTKAPMYHHSLFGGKDRKKIREMFNHMYDNDLSTEERMDNFSKLGHLRKSLFDIVSNIHHSYEFRKALLTDGFDSYIQDIIKTRSISSFEHIKEKVISFCETGSKNPKEKELYKIAKDALKKKRYVNSMEIEYIKFNEIAYSEFITNAYESSRRIDRWDQWRNPPKMSERDIPIEKREIKPMPLPGGSIRGYLAKRYISKALNEIKDAGSKYGSIGLFRSENDKELFIERDFALFGRKEEYDWDNYLREGRKFSRNLKYGFEYGVTEEEKKLFIERDFAHWKKRHECDYEKYIEKKARDEGEKYLYKAFDNAQHLDIEQRNNLFRNFPNDWKVDNLLWRISQKNKHFAELIEESREYIGRCSIEMEKMGKEGFQRTITRYRKQ